MPTIIWDGTSQDQRLSPALRPGYVRPDEMGMPELLYLGARHAGLLAYHDLEGRRSGDWQALFYADESVIQALVLVEANRLDRWRLEFQRFQRRIEALSLGLATCPTAEEVPVYRLARHIQSWLQGCERSSGQGAQRLQDVITGLLAAKLAPALNGQMHLLRRYDSRHGANLLAELGPRWQVQPGTAMPPPVSAGQPALTRFLRNNYLAFAHSVMVIKNTAAEAFPVSLESRNHDPAMGMFIAFAHLYMKAKASLDDFNQRHLRFYYEQVLRFRPRLAQPDVTYLVLRADGNAAETPLARGTVFLGPDEPDGRGRLYASDDDLRVTDARVTALHTLYLLRDQRHSPERDMGEPGFVSSAWIADIPSASAHAYYPLFGAPASAGGNWKGRQARLGFALASPVLLLKEGLREIEFTLLWRASGLSLESLVTKLQGIIPTPSWEGAFFKAFAHMFRIRLTTDRGWREIGDWTPVCQRLEPGIPEHALVIRARLADDFPPVVGYQAAVHGESYDTRQPVATFEVSTDAYLYPYDFLRTVFIEQVIIRVQVRGCRDLLLYNQHGLLSAAAPFAPFGPVPRLGAYLVVGNPEAAGKNLTALSLRMRWDDLPIAGLTEHYRNYGLEIGPSSFRAELGVLSDRSWQPAKRQDRPVVDLLGALDEEGRARYDCRNVLPYLLATEAGAEFAYGPQARGGFIRLALSAPTMAFGHAEYPMLLAQALTDNARLETLGPIRRLIGNRLERPIPRAPYTPLASSIALDYSAQVSFGMEQSGESVPQGRLYHLHPLGIAPVPLDARGARPLIPDLRGDANLYIGLDAREPGGPLSLYFQLRDDSLLRIDEPRPDFSWQYLRNNDWCEIEAFRVLSDTTCGFLRSGVVRLDLPRDMTRDDTLMPGRFYWLKLSSGSSAARLCSVHAIHAHGVRVTRFEDADGAGLSGQPMLPAGSIGAARTSLAGIGKVQQPEDSFGGVAPETLEALTVRAGERLRHRQRAVTPWDYERLVLQRFPRIVKAKCFANTRYGPDPAAWFSPGHVLVVVVSNLKGGQQANDEKRENALVLQEIQDFLARLTSPFVRLEVRNPVLESIQVRCRVGFRQRDGVGALIAQLNRDIGELVSPWGSLGGPVNFGWSLRCQEIQSRIQSLPYVESVSGLSLLRLVSNGEDYYSLHDTARQSGSAQAAIDPVYPWSLPIPFRYHLIETDGSGGARPSGISHLQVGRSFIVSGRQNGQEKSKLAEE